MVRVTPSVDLIAQLTEVINVSVSRAVQAHFDAIHRPQTQNARPNSIPHRDSRTSMQNQNNTSSNQFRDSNWFDSDNLFEEEEHISTPTRRSSSHDNRNEFLSSSRSNMNENRNLQSRSQARSVFEWNFHFTGLDPSEDPKGLEIEAFIQKILDYGRSENLSES